ncbi:MAG: restriction endonuclease subunit S [Candidatus Absconditabacteria bacterium]
MKKKLKEIAIIQSGYFIKSLGVGDVFYIQTKDVEEFGFIKNNLVKELRCDQIRDNQLLEPGDVLYASKGVRNIATVYSDDIGPSVASSAFFVIKLTDGNYLPEYIKIVLNESQNTNYFKNNLSGGTIKLIGKSVLENFEVKKISLDKQHQLINMYNLYLKELDFYSKLKDKKTKLINKIVLDYTN